MGGLPTGALFHGSLANASLYQGRPAWPRITVSKQPRTKKHRRRPAASADADTPRRTVRLTLDTLEVARGHDGFLRGKPEPALLIGLYRANAPAPASLVGRLLVRAELNSEMPCSVALGQQALHYDARFAVTERILVLAFAVEEDSGDGVQALYRALEAPEQILLYAALDAVPAPRSLSDWSREECTAPTAAAVEVLLATANLKDLAGSDDYISTSAFSVATQARTDEVWRLPFIAGDARNDWTLVLRMQVVA